ncbi:serine/threonine protein kinase [Mycobacterium intermedium]|uniref:non-specific serine/threonine protein kinase n=1 Tax=Mycobacterium intermedium TaxID=28445 RepID=A0A1E3SF84_MYCIE|nr:serine/threonine-protein kinase [Mycobacterium intermedium]MCV6966676.1 serine/threonine protein kinase [Mycobacterium intermedium]ODR00807.1 hypothetical protein BHQ20_11490 [Mycobacterium intermedium]OPE52125.1 serine/threonine protein kinase [Mycobacterium intermedium]ORB10587.1 serine/threonine protein kinase [Mycobacterium intermedium]
MSLQVGQVFAGYTILRVLGSGGMGSVYLARHPRLPREDALKVLSPELTNDAEFRARFLREAEVAATLSHPNIVRIHDRGEYDGQFWISMDYVPGTDPAQLQRERFPGGMPLDQVATIITAVASALDYAHHRGLLHRDVKPANILLAEADGQPRRVYLADFGIARRIEDSTGLTATNIMLGTASYAAPEQLKGEPLDGRADQYALACTAFHLLTGSAPYVDSNPVVVITQHVTAPPPSIGARRPELARLDPVFTRAMAKKPADRFDSCSEFAARLRQDPTMPAYAQDIARTVTAPTVPGAGPQPAGKRPRSRALIGALAGIGLLLVAGGVFAGIKITQRPDSAPQAGAPPGATSTTPTRAPNTGPFTGAYRANFGAATSIDIDVPGPGMVPSTDNYAVRSTCGPGGCRATAAHLGGETTFAPTLVFDKIGDRWVSVALGHDKCQDAPAEIWEVFILKEGPPGTLTGDFTATTANDCVGKHTVTFTRIGDVDVDSLPDPSALPARVVPPAEALRGQYHQRRTFKIRAAPQEIDYKVTTHCLRTGDRCMSFFHNFSGAVEPLVFADGNWTLHTEHDGTCPGRGSPTHVKKTGQYPLPQPPQDPITLLTGQGTQEQTGSCAVSVGFDESFTRTGD